MRLHGRDFDHQTSIDLAELEMLDFDIIMGIDWLVSCYANIMASVGQRLLDFLFSMKGNLGMERKYNYAKR